MFNLYYHTFNKQILYKFMNILLMGYMGSGKSTLGKNLSLKFKRDFIDLDHYIEQKENKKVYQIFQEKGDLYFRNIEREYLSEILSKNSKIILSLGGGTPCYNNNIELINSKYNLSFYLKNSNIELTKRLFNQRSSRPLISGISSKESLLEYVSKHLFEREIFYSAASHTIKCDNKSVAEISEEVFSILM